MKKLVIIGLLATLAAPAIHAAPSKGARPAEVIRMESDILKDAKIDKTRTEADPNKRRISENVSRISIVSGMKAAAESVTLNNRLKGLVDTELRTAKTEVEKTDLGNVAKFADEVASKRVELLAEESVAQASNARFESRLDSKILDSVFTEAVETRNPLMLENLSIITGSAVTKLKNREKVTLADGKVVTVNNANFAFFAAAVEFVQKQNPNLKTTDLKGAAFQEKLKELLRCVIGSAAKG